MDNMLDIASGLASRAPAPKEAVPARTFLSSSLGQSVAAAVVGAVVLAELTVGRQRTTVLQVEPQLTVEVTDAPT